MLLFTTIRRTFARSLTAVAVALCLLAVDAGSRSSLAEPVTRVASWNIRHLGWDNGKDYHAVGQVAAYFDLIAVQEVMTEEGIERLRRKLAERTGESWAALTSHSIGRTTYREMYSFLWRESAVEYVDGALVYLDRDNVFAREPFSARFRTSDGFRFVLANIHAIYGENVAERQAEARALRDYWDFLSESFPDDVVFIAGDFNLAPTNPAWAPLMEVATPLITEGNTTISTIDGRFANLYDNLWVPHGVPLPVVRSGRLEFPHQVLGIDHAQARLTVSDHIPVWMELSARATAVLSPYSAARAQPTARAPAAPQAASPSGRTAAPTAASPSGATGRPPVVGNSNSGIYHWAGCPGHATTAEANVVPFQTRDQAERAGFRAARNCR